MPASSFDEWLESKGITAYHALLHEAYLLGKQQMTSTKVAMLEHRIEELEKWLKDIRRAIQPNDAGPEFICLGDNPEVGEILYRDFAATEEIACPKCGQTEACDECSGIVG